MDFDSGARWQLLQFLRDLQADAFPILCQLRFAPFESDLLPAQQLPDLLLDPLRLLFHPLPLLLCSLRLAARTHQLFDPRRSLRPATRRQEHRRLLDRPRRAAVKVDLEHLVARSDAHSHLAAPALEQLRRRSAA
eukprot:2111604-Rhodomonas_salina.10